MLEGEMIVRVTKHPVFYRGDLQLYAGVLRRDGWDVAQPAVFTRVPDQVAPPDAPLLPLTTASAQGLMDSLWECGIRPTQGTGSAGALAATEKHLADFRRLVFDPPGWKREL